MAYNKEALTYSLRVTISDLCAESENLDDRDAEVALEQVSEIADEVTKENSEEAATAAIEDILVDIWEDNPAIRKDIVGKMDLFWQIYRDSLIDNA